MVGILLARGGHLLLGCSFVVSGIATYSLASWERAASEWGLTASRLVVRSGLFAHRSFDIPLSSVEAIIVTQSFFGRIFAYGTVEVRGDGGSSELFFNLDEPLIFATRARRLASSSRPRVAS